MMHVMTDGNRTYEVLLPLSTSPIQYEPYQEEFLTPNVTLYTPYIVTQLMVKPTEKTDPKEIMNDVGNSYGTQIEFSVVEHQ